MTVAAALVRNGRIWMGADSAIAYGQMLDLLGDGNSKVFEKKAGNEVCLVAGAGSARLLQLLEHKVDLPALPDSTEPTAMMRWFVVDVIEKLRSTLKERGIMTTKDGIDSVDGTSLVGVRGRLYEIDHGLYVKAVVEPFAAVGSGCAQAHGVFHAIEEFKIECDPERAVRIALEAAERRNPGVRGPFQIIHS